MLDPDTFLTCGALGGAWPRRRAAPCAALRAILPGLPIGLTRQRYWALQTAMQEDRFPRG
jgi:hypothetical protein